MFDTMLFLDKTMAEIMQLRNGEGMIKLIELMQVGSENVHGADRIIDPFGML